MGEVYNIIVIAWRRNLGTPLSGRFTTLYSYCIHYETEELINQPNI